MAQRTIHMLFAKLVADKLEISDLDRFYLGSILPDAYVEATDRKVAHFIKYMPEDNCLFFDFQDFATKYQKEIIEDNLYLGYYAHLVEDAFYRYYEKDMLSKIKSYKLDILHQDYRILNSYIDKHYDLPKQIKVPDRFNAESLNDITAFNVDKLTKDYSNDLQECVNEKTKLLTEEMIEEFISKYIDVLTSELLSIQKSYSTLNALDYKWLNKNV